MNYEELVRKYEERVINIFKNDYNKAVINSDLGIIVQFTVRGELFSYTNSYSINSFGNKEKTVQVADNCYKIDFKNNVFKPTLKHYGDEFINECFKDYYLYMKSYDVNNFKITYPYFNIYDKSTTWFIVNGFLIERDEGGLPLMSAAIFYEVDEHKELKDELKKQNKLLKYQVQNFRNAEEVGNLGSFLCDLKSKHNKFWASDNYAKMLGFKLSKDKYYSFKDKEEWIKENIIDETEEMYTTADKFINGEILNYEYTYKASIKGETKWFQTKANSLKKDDSGKVTKYIGTVKDVTEIKENELKLYNAMRVAEKDNDAKTSFIAHISHEIRTPLNAIIGYTNLISNQKQMKKIRDYSKKINYSAKILLSLINDVLDLSKITNNKLEMEHIDFNFTQEISQLIESFKVFVDEKDLKLVYFIDKNIPPLLNGDLLKIKQVITNLLSNSIKFTHEGFVAIKVNFDKLEEKQVLNFEITDTGIGIEDEEVKNLFEPFTQGDNSTTRKYGGTGLGLTICKQLVEMMGGHISVSSKINCGTTFKFDIPINEVNSNGYSNLVESIDKPISDKRILVVEDNEVNSLLIEELLKANNLKNIEVSVNGEEAIEVIRNKDFDIILMDIQMPIMDGVEATKYIRKEFPEKNLKIFALTANVLKEQIDEYMKVGFDDYISKPIDVSILLNKIYS
ncbi:ATP-binding protein [Mycoplasmatota bacterium WC44]